MTAGSAPAAGGSEEGAPVPRVFFTADSHFGHKGILRLSARPFPDVEAMDEAMVEAWNAAVGASDLVYHLGDFCFRGSKPAAKVLARLNGEIVLLRGNHDSENTVKLPRWRSVHDLLEITVERTRLVLCHYPLLEWPGAFKGAVHLHGHTHGAVPPNRQRMDVGVDVWGYRPVRLEDILKRLSAEPPYDPRSHYADAAAGEPR
ncbi:MAG: metallophosphoesterase [Pseudomonadota bacterium]